ncbi:Histone-lysine N-methyltransferase ATXR3 [Sesamum angolense]|uniref:Histone-lysine N-methyltransferase ATXR3 n=1 Tax=Sesamum angolense TaxID=2727404 RepID=A0AAE1T4F4_9LAMI|nr:Histone-lysine N-methyltransferase ATXR3 [Sesamum angolense]
MGDGGVACVPSQHIMEKFSICGAKTNGTKLSSSSNSSTRLAKVSPNMKPKKDKGSELGSKDFGSLSKEVAGRNATVMLNDNSKEEVEEGELGTLLSRMGSLSLKNRSSKDELEKGEFVPDRWCKVMLQTGLMNMATQSHEGMTLLRKNDGKASGNGLHLLRRKGDGKVIVTANRHHFLVEEKVGKLIVSGRHLLVKRKDGGVIVSVSGHHLQQTQKTSSKLVGDEGSLKNEVTNSKSHAREHSFSNRLKRPGNDSNGGDRKFRVDYDEYSSSKNRKISNDGSRSGFSSDHYSGRTTDRQYKSASSSSRSTPSERYSSRYLESSRAVHDRHNSSPHHPERSPRNWAFYHDNRDRSPSRRDTPSHDQGQKYDQSRSPYDHNHNRYQSPSYVERSPHDHDQNSDIRDRTPTSLERSPHDRGRYCDHRETNRKAGVGEKPPSHASKGQGGKINLMTESGGREAQFLGKESPDSGNLNNKNVSTEKTANDLCHHEELLLSPALKSIASCQENGVSEEPASMEEDMDICNTPPHAPLVENAVAGKWYYLDHSGVERGPSKLSDLKTLVKEGYLVSDHLIRHLDSDRWVTVEKAVSPLVTANFHSIVPDTVTRLVCPPEAPGNLLGDNGNGVSGNAEILGPSAHPIFCPKENLAASEPEEDLRIDDRVGALLEDVTLIPGKEVEMLAEVLQIMSEHGSAKDGKFLGSFAGYTRHQQDMDDHLEERGVESWRSGSELEDIAESRPTLIASSEKDNALTCSDTGESFSGEWACKGCDWKRNDEATQERTWKRKLVLNDGYPLCQMPKSGCEDPRWEEKDELCYPSQSKRLDLPLWAFNSADELNDSSSMSRLSQTRAPFVRGVRGMMLPVIRINACVVKDHGSFVSEPRIKVRGKERFSSRSSRPHSATVDTKRSSEDVQSKGAHEEGSQDSRKKSAYFSIPRDRICKVEELKLHLDQGVIQKNSSVFRKRDKSWVPVTLPCEPSGISDHENNAASCNKASGAVSSEMQRISSSFHGLHPQFIGYTRGKLHELVMKSYKSREFAAAINEVLDPWINARQPRKISKSTFTIQNDECEFDDLCGDVTFRKGEAVDSEVERGSWDLLDGHVLARVFHFLRADIKSLSYAALTCKHWQSVVKFYKDVSRQVDFGAIAPNCSNSVVLKIMNGYKKEKITSLLLRGCTGITSGMLEELLQSFPFLSSIDVRGCPQLEDLVCKFPNINWVKSRVPHVKIRSLNHLSERSSSASNQMDDSSGLKEYLESSDKRDSANQLFRRSLYKRSKLFDARKSSSILSRDAQLRRLAIKKTGNGYKRMEGYIATCLRDIMSENTFDFFESKVAEIDERMRNGYYVIRGLDSIKEDISRMCREAIKGNGPPFTNGHFDSGDYASDREIRRRLSKLNKKFLHSGSDTSDDFDKSSDGSTADSISTASETESDLGYTSEGAIGESRGETYFAPDDGLDSLADEREWGARMTKAGLVPPVTRKYEVIDHYIIVADEDEVRRKMQVSLPEDYAEKLNAQRNGTEESDMEIPEVKDYKPRKSLGDEVIEQEVYGIDPYTHNLLLDSMPEESDWSLVDKHIFIEEVLLRTLNKQVRSFTGSGTLR